MVRNTVKKIRAELQESHNAYEDVVTPQKKGKRCSPHSRPRLYCQAPEEGQGGLQQVYLEA